MPYKNREDLYKAQKRYREQVRKNLTEYLLQNPCVVCGEKDPIVLDFDHLEPSTKVKNIAKFLSGHTSWNTILKEISKCRVLCANCHRRHTYKQQSHWGKTQ
jgi:hypothetical protein